MRYALPKAALEKLFSIPIKGRGAGGRFVNLALKLITGSPTVPYDGFNSAVGDSILLSSTLDWTVKLALRQLLVVCQCVHDAAVRVRLWHDLPQRPERLLRHAHMSVLRQRRLPDGLRKLLPDRAAAGSRLQRRRLPKLPQ